MTRLRISGTWMPLGHGMTMFRETGLMPKSIRLWHPIICPEKICMRLTYYKEQLRCVVDIMRLVYCGAMRRLSCLTISEAERRMQSLKRKFSSQPDLEDRFRAVMEDYIAKGHARKLSPEEAANRGPRTW